MSSSFSAYLNSLVTVMDKDLPLEQIQGFPTLDPMLLPAFQSYKQENQSWLPGPDIWDYLSTQADLELAAAFVTMFRPDFIEVEGCVFLARNYSPESYAAWITHFDGDKPAVESMINHIHLWDLFRHSEGASDSSEQLYEYMATALMSFWKAALQDAFPARDFVFTLRHGYGPEISFHQIEAE